MSEQAKPAAPAPANPEAAFVLSPITRGYTWLILTPFLKFWARLRVVGKEHIPAGGRLIAVSNHQSMIDPFVVAYVFYRNVRYMAKTELFQHPLMGWIIKRYGAFPVERARRDPQSLRTALNVVRAEQVLGMFPEGTRSSSGELQEFRTGAIRLAIKGQAQIIPIGIWGANRILPPGAPWPRPGRLGLAVGTPITYAHLYDHHPTPAEIAAAADDLEQQIAALIRQAEGLWQK